MKYTFKFPDELVIGYQERTDAMTGKLAFINFKEKNKLRIEKEFNYWCSYLLDDKFKNIPRSGFLISKAVERSHQSLMSGRSYMRIYDPAGFDFEISMSNLEYILNNCNVNNGELEGEFVYLWLGKSLLLIPTHTEYYKEALRLKDNEKEKITTKDLKVGAIYQDKKHDVLYTYFGRYDYYKEYSRKEKENYFDKIIVPQNRGSYSCYYYDDVFNLPPHVLKPKKQHIFFNHKTGQYEVNIANKLAFIVSDESDDYQDHLLNYLNSRYGTKTNEIKMEKLDKSNLKSFFEKLINHYSKDNYVEGRPEYSKEFNNFSTFLKISENYYLEVKLNHRLSGYFLEESETRSTFSFKLQLYYLDTVNNVLVDDKLDLYLSSDINHDRYEKERKYLTKSELSDIMAKVTNSVDEILEMFNSDKKLIVNDFLDTDFHHYLNKINYHIDTDIFNIILLKDKLLKIITSDRRDKVEEIKYQTEDLKEIFDILSLYDFYEPQRILKDVQ